MKTVELGRSGRRSRQQAESDNLFGWTVFILLLCGFAVACWIGTFYVFTHPEEPFNYHILAKLKKLDPPKRFELTAAPTGEFLAPDKLLAKYGTMNSWQVDEESKRLLRAYLRNYDHQVGKIPYVTGKFTVLDSIPLSPSKFCDSGVAALAQSVDVPTVYIEHIFPANSDQIPAMQRTLVTGLGIELRRSYDLSAVVHVEVLEGGRLLFTCMPLLYGPYGTTQGGSGFHLDPPETLNLKGGLPLVTGAQFHDADQRLAEYRRAMATQQTTAAAQSGAKSQTSLVESQPTPMTGETKSQPLPATTASAGIAAATPKSASTSNQATAAMAKPTAPSVAAATSAPTPKATPTPFAVAAATPAQPLQPFLTASPTLPTEGHVESWQTYHPGQMPRGRLLDVDQTAELADRGVGGATMYLRGDFTVTAVRDNRAVLRPRQSFTDHFFNRGNARVIVEYQRGAPTPHEGDNFQRGSSRPFQIVDIRRGADGQVNIYAREVTTEE